MFQTTNQISFFTSLGGGKPKKKTNCLQWLFIIEYTHITGHFRIRLIGGTDSVYKAYVWGLNFREYPHNSYGQTYGTFTHLQFRILEFLLTIFVM